MEQTSSGHSVVTVGTLCKDDDDDDDDDDEGSETIGEKNEFAFFQF